MPKIDLQEYRQSEPVSLTPTELNALKSKELSLTITPTGNAEGMYYLTPSSTVGAFEVGDLSVLIEPKIGIPQLLSLACYAIDKVGFRQEQFDFPDEYALPDVLALSLASAARRAFTCGLLHGYRVKEEGLYTVRGRIRFDEQIRCRFGIPLPIEVRYDEFTDDILANRLVKAAAHQLGRMRLHSQKARTDLGWVVGMLDNISLIAFPPKDVPDIKFDRLNVHYREVVSLSQLILQHNAYEADRGKVHTSGFLMDINKVFQEFVTVALREALGLNERMFRESKICSLDEAGRVHLRPDLTWWDGSDCTFVGDAKYKRIENQQVPNADLYQLLSYVTALDLPGGLLIYAKGEAESVVHEIRHSCKRLEVAALDLSGSLKEILACICCLAERVRTLRDEARGLLRAA